MEHEIQAGMPLALNADCLSTTGLILPENLTEQQVDQIGQQLATIQTGTQWWIGDYWNYRQRKGWGDGPEIAERLGINYSVARVYASVSASYQLLMRINNLSFNHHQIVAPISEPRRSELLQWAVETGASTRELRQKLRDHKLADPERLPEGKYRVIYADPPWQYSDERLLDGYQGTAASDHYPTMPVEEICNLQIENLADPDSCALLCWATFPLLPEALAVVRAWGFVYKTAIVWDKDRPNMGNYHDASAELLLIATRGSAVSKVRPKQIQTVRREGRHSEKPEHFRKMIDSMYPDGGRIELFRRGNAPDGWHVWGNEAGDV